MSIVPSDNAGSHSHLVLFVKMSNPDATADDRCIAIHGTIEEHGLDRKANDTTDCDAAAAAVSRRVVRDGAGAHREHAAKGIEDAAAAAAASCLIARDGAIGEHKHALVVDDAPESFAVLEG